MKKMLLLIAFVLLSCSKNDNNLDNVQLTNAELTSSTWNINSFTLGGEEVNLDECKAESNLKFTQNKMLRTWAYWRDLEKTECYTYTDEFQYSLKGENILIENSTENINYTVKIKDENTIVISHSSNGNDFVETYKR